MIVGGVPFGSGDNRLGMELHAERRIVSAFDALDHTIRRNRRHTKTGRDFLDGLVVMAIDGQVLRAEYGRQPRPRHDLHLVGGGMPLGMQVFAGRMADVRLPLLEFTRQILPERTAEADVDELAAAADTHDRQAPRRS